MSEMDHPGGSDEQMPIDEELAKAGPSTSKRMKLDQREEDRSVNATRITRRSARMGGTKSGYEANISSEQSNISEKPTKDVSVTKEMAKAAADSMDVGKPPLQLQGESREDRLKRRQKDDSNEKDDEEKSNTQQDLEDELDEESPGKANKQRATIHLLDNSTQSKIKVGQQHQAVLTAYESKTNSLIEDREDRDQALWIPLANGELSPADIDKYTDEAMTLHMIPLDRALFILLKSDYNLEVARQKLSKRKFIRDEWSYDDSVVFQNAFNYYGKNFNIIQKALQHRTINSIVNHYYNVKKSFSLKHNPTKNENDDDRLEDFDDAEFGCCENCGEKPTKVLYTSGGRLCSSCFIYYTVMHKYRPVDGASKTAPQYRREVRCPPDMTNVVAEFEELVIQATQNAKDTNSAESEEASSSAGSVVRSIESLIQERDQQVRSQINGMRQKVFAATERTKALQKNLVGGVEAYQHFLQREKQEEEENKGRRQRLDYKWTEDEKKKAFHLIARYGLEGLSTVAHILQTKNVEQVKAFIKENEEPILKYLHTIETEEENMAKAMNIDDELLRDQDVVVLD